ncbi:hypothetical protein [Streptomyces sp. NPDC047315]|uniref:hypothetical protein n=1 Tax=Streptomyces sp. NPDC047315 TaxID=3155142 RepID=UPI003409E08A
MNVISKLGRGLSRLLEAEPAGVDDAWRTVERMTAVCAVISSLEQLSARGDRSRESTLPWGITRVRLRRLNQGRGRRLGEAVLPRDEAMAAVRLAAGARLLLGRPGHTERTLLLAVLASTGITGHIRNGGLGMDGSDHLSTVNFTTALLDKFPGNTKGDRTAVLCSLALQSALAYSTSGLVKLTSPTWRSGDAITGVLRTKTYGDRDLFSLVQGRPALAKAMAWSVIVAETAFPVVLVLPPRAARACFAAGVVFHLANGRYMGLNRFLWAFTATYPAVDFARGRLRAALPRAGRS